jgi:poly(A) polymerase
MEAWHDPRVRTILTAIAELAQESYVVGGTVRDLLVGRSNRKDLDVAVKGDGFQIARQAADRIERVATFVPLDSEHGTGRIVFRDEPPVTVDVTSFRASTLSEDLRARDFTINAMAVATHDFLVGRRDYVIDPTGGKTDLRARKIRACSSSSFQDDPVRILRAFRFMASLEFEICQSTLEAMPSAIGELLSTAPERIRDELIATLAAESSSPALRKMDTCGVLETLFPELQPMIGCAQNEYHHLDVWGHSLETVHRLELLLAGEARKFGGLSPLIESYCRQEPVKDRPRRGLLKLAAIFHDSGKPVSRFVDSRGKTRFFGHERVSQQIFDKVGRRLKLASREIAFIGEIIAGHMRPSIFTGKEVSLRAIHRMHTKYQSNVTGLLLLFLADLEASRGPARRLEAYALAWNQILRAMAVCLEAETAPLKPLLTGRDLISEFLMSPGPLLGRILTKLMELQAAGEITTRGDAIEAARKLLARE